MSHDLLLPTTVLLAIWFCVCAPTAGTELPQVRDVEGQPLAANVRRLVEALDYLGASLPEPLRHQLAELGRKRDAAGLQHALDPHVLFTVSINPELRVKVNRGVAPAVLQQSGFAPCIVKVINAGTISNQLRIVSPQSGPVYSGASIGILKRQDQTYLLNNPNSTQDPDRFVEVEMFQKPPMTRNLSGLEVEYAIALLYSSESGKREITIGFDIGGGNQDIGFRGETPVLFEVEPAVPVALSILDSDGTPTAARLTIRDQQEHVFPPQVKRLAPDFFFQPQIYRHSGDTLLLPPGEFTVRYSRGPEYVEQETQLRVQADGTNRLNLRLKRWVDPAAFGFYSGDHHIHAAGCSHYDSPTQGVRPSDMFTQVKGEGLNVGCVLTWGPCFDHQRTYFSPQADSISEDMTLMKYDLEISGFGSAALGHVCLLNLTNQTYPGSEASKEKGWPTWTVPVLRWAKRQGGVTGYPHSAFDIDNQYAADRLLEILDSDKNGTLDAEEAEFELLPETFASVDQNGDARLDHTELAAATGREADRLPNVAIPNMNGGGALEICVSTAEGVCDFISAMDTPRISEWTIWYHLMNCGFPLKLSGETDFPCMSSRRVGQGRVYVDLGHKKKLNFVEWCQGLGKGQSYVSDGFAHALRFEVNGVKPGREDVRLKTAERVSVTALVSFAPETPEGVAYGNVIPEAGRQWVGDTVNLHAPRSMKSIEGGQRLVELVMNGEVVGQQSVPADGQQHELNFDVDMQQSSWIALRHFPQLHTNPVRVIVDDRPIRSSRASALWCAESVKLLWRDRNHRIHASERNEAQKSYEEAIRKFEQIADEAS